MQVSWQQSYSTRSRVQDVRLRYRSRLQSYQRGRVTCMVLRNKIIMASNNPIQSFHAEGSCLSVACGTLSMEAIPCIGPPES